MRTLVLLSLVLISCNNNNTDNKVIANTDTVKQAASIKVDSSNTVDAKPTTDTNSLKFFVWHIEFYKKKKTRNQYFKREWLNVDSLIRGLNAGYPEIKLDKVRMSGDTLYTKIDDSEYLGERIGSDGAQAYIANAVINLTSLKEIRFVKMDFEDGSHISPGTWSAKDFKEYEEEK